MNIIQLRLNSYAETIQKSQLNPLLMTTKEQPCNLRLNHGSSMRPVYILLVKPSLLLQQNNNNNNNNNNSNGNDNDNKEDNND